MHHRFALQQYGRAIRRMKESLTTGGKDYRTAVIVCLLTICFEALNGDMQSALAQVRNGLKLIKEWRQQMTNRSLEFDIASSLPLSDSELIQAFDRLDNNSIMIMDAEPVDNSSQIMADTGPSHEIPLVFTSIEDARAHWEFLLRQMLHWVASAYAWGSREKAETDRRAQPTQGLSRDSLDLLQLQKAFLKQREQHLKGFRQWRLAFQPLWVHSRTPAGQKDFAAATSLELRFKSTFTSLVADHFKGETCYDEYSSDYEEVVRLAEALIEYEKTHGDTRKAAFTSDGPIIPSVYVVILKCRDRIIRRRAIALLKSRPRRDVVMDSALIEKI